MSYAIIAAFLTLIVYALYADLTSYRLPNHISIGLIALFSLAMAFTQPSLAIIGGHIVTGLIVFAVGFLLYVTISFGGGDVKFLSSLALWLGPDDVLRFLLLMSLFGGILALILLGFRRFKLPSRWKENSALSGLHSPENGVPYGVAMAIAILLMLPDTAAYNLLMGL